jgi:hypothetical protein
MLQSHVNFHTEGPSRKYSLQISLLIYCKENNVCTQMILREVSVIRGKGFERDVRNHVARIWAELK